jgi:D-3-phosphoglycerate dehydrogenase / 2-oxoglutarate reductase
MMFSALAMKIKVLMRSSSFKQILDHQLKQKGLESELVDMNRPLGPQISDAEILINGPTKLDRGTLEMCPKLVLVHQAGIGYDNVDLDYCNSKSIQVANVPLANSIAVAEHTLFLMIFLAKNIQVAQGSLMKRRIAGVMGSELYGKTLLIIGLGSSGTEVAKRAKAFGMKVLAITKDPIIGISNKPGWEKSYSADEIKSPESLKEYLPLADYVSLHLPLNRETEGLIGVRELELMKKSAYLVNVARGPIVDKEALFNALAGRRIAGAAFDVFWDEPASPDDRMLKLENFVLTPHIAGWTRESVEAIAAVIAANVARVAEGKSALTLVDKSR